MIPADSFLEPARARGFDFFTGVPCSFLTPIINRVIGEPGLRYVGATSEGEAVAIAAGAWLAGRKTVVMCQNSGLGNMVNPLTSLNHPFRIPTLLIVTWRGQPGLVDEPQHELMGRICSDLLEEMLIPHALFPKSEGEVGPALDEAERLLAESSLPFAFIMEKGAV
ncbi:MAG: thiamine pyrophosphate-binding protein, partial [Alphaproteobacteria bacterium]